jgi:hypothetical protein
MTLPWTAEIGRFVHFSNSPTLELEIRRAVVTGGPRGLYTYKIEPRTRYTLALDRPYAHILRGVGRELDTGTYTQKDLERDLGKLRRIVDLAPAEKALERQATKLNSMLDRRYVDVPAGRLYYLIGRQLRKPDPEDPPQWSNGASVEDPAYTSELFRQLGYDYFTDRFGIIWSSEPDQTVFFHAGAFQVEKTMKLHDRGPVRLSATQNPARVPRPSPDELEAEKDPERRRFVATAADRIRSAAGELVAEGRGFGNKVWIVDVAERLSLPVLRLAPLLVRMHRMGLVELVRRDLGVRGDDVGKKVTSEITYGDGTATYHYVVAGPKKNPGAATISFTDAKDVIASPNPLMKLGKFDSAEHMRISKAVRENLPVKSAADVNLYFSRLRPLFGLRIPNPVTLFDRWGASLEPLTPAEVVKFELVPVGRAMGWFMFDCGIALKKTLEYTKVAMPEDGFGPTGHNENDDPVTLLTEVWRDGFRHWAPGAIDMIGERLIEMAPKENPAPRGVRRQNLVVKTLPATLPGVSVFNSEDAVKAFFPYIQQADEFFVVLFLNARNKAIGFVENTSGSMTYVAVDVSGIARAALTAGAVAAISAHQHPSGDPTPSVEDVLLWKQIERALETVGIKLLDNMVLGESQYYTHSDANIQEYPAVILNQLRGT